MFKKGESGNPAGRPRRSTVKDKIQAVYEGLGGVEAMTEWAKKNKTEFYKLYGRLIPTDINIEGDSAFAEAISSLGAFMVKAEDARGEGLNSEAVGEGGPLLSPEVSPTTH